MGLGEGLCFKWALLVTLRNYPANVENASTTPHLSSLKGIGDLIKKTCGFSSKLFVCFTLYRILDMKFERIGNVVICIELSWEIFLETEG